MAKKQVVKIKKNRGVDLSQYNNFDEDRAKRLADELDASDSNAMINFGTGSIDGHGTASKKLFKEVETDKAGEAGEALVQLVKIVDGVGGTEDEPSSLVKLFSKVPLIGAMLNKVVDKAETVVLAQRDIESNIQSIEKKLDDSCEVLMRDNVMVNNLESESLEYIIENNTNLKAIEFKLVEYNSIIEEKIEEINGFEGEDDLLSMELSKLQGIRNSLEKKKATMNSFKTQAILELPEFDMMRRGNTDLVEKINQTVQVIVPLWRKQMAKFILLERQSKTAKVLAATTESTNKFLMSSSEKMKDNTLRIAEEMEKDVIAFETMEITANNLRDTIKGALAIQQNGKKRRDELEGKLEDLRSKTSDDIQNSISQMQDSYTEDVDFVEVTEEEKLHTSFSSSEAEAEA